jgi:hypothetical protein
MVHDRRINGQAATFGSASRLCESAMTWWDHETYSIWSQPNGRAIEGDLAGIELRLLPSELIPWSDWLLKHPHSLLMSNDLNRFARQPQYFEPDFVIGVVLGENARAYNFKDVAARKIINDRLGSTPVLIWAAEEQTAVFCRLVNEQELTFRIEDSHVRDNQTGSTWDLSRGLAVAGPLRGTALRQIPSLTCYDWAWKRFYPQSTLYGDDLLRS